MTSASTTAIEPGTNSRKEPIFPKWIFEDTAPQTTADAAFSSGSALALLHVVVNDPDINAPVELLRNRLALRAAANCLKIEGRGQTEADIRDAVLLTAAGDAKGPAGDLFVFWCAHSGVGGRLGLRHTDWQKKLCECLPDDMRPYVLEWLKETADLSGSPVAKAITFLTKVTKNFPRQEALALLCADVVLARALGWGKPIPLFGSQLKRSIFVKMGKGEDVRIACHVAVARAAQDAVRLAYDLARRAANMRSVAPKLRAKGSDAAVKLFLSEDAVSPSSMLSPKIKGTNIPMTDRSARRLCDRLVELGVVRELTGRKTFRLYGL